MCHRVISCLLWDTFGKSSFLCNFTLNIILIYTITFRQQHIKKGLNILAIKREFPTWEKYTTLIQSRDRSHQSEFFFCGGNLLRLFIVSSELLLMVVTSLSVVAFMYLGPKYRRSICILVLDVPQQEPHKDKMTQFAVHTVIPTYCL